MKWPSHGSNPQYIYEAMNLEKPEQIVDLSANINAMGPPLIIREKWMEFYGKIGDYPDPYGVNLRNSIAAKENLSIESVLLGNGGAELITLVGRFLAGKNVLIVQPTFSEYEKACQVNGCHVDYHYLDENWGLNLSTIELDGIEAVFLCNPNNPTGVCFPYETVKELSMLCSERGVYLVIDEAFYDFWGNYQSLTPLVGEFENVILLRSMTKMFAIPGIRLGYLLANESVVRSIGKYQPHWSVNVLALQVGEICLNEKEYIRQTNQYIQKEREKLFSFFEQEKFVVSPSQINFYLLRDAQLENPNPLFEFLLRNGIVPRHTMNFPGLEGYWLRFAIKSASDNNLLREVLKEWKR